MLFEYRITTHRVKIHRKKILLKAFLYDTPDPNEPIPSTDCGTRPRSSPTIVSYIGRKSGSPP